MNKEIKILNELICYCDKRSEETQKYFSGKFYGKIANGFKIQIEKIQDKIKNPAC